MKGNLGMKKVTEIAIAFCNKIYEAGYTPIIYSNRDFFTNYLDLDKLNALAYNYWYASPKDDPNFSEEKEQYILISSVLPDIAVLDGE